MKKSKFIFVGSIIMLALTSCSSKPTSTDADPTATITTAIITSTPVPTSTPTPTLTPIPVKESIEKDYSDKIISANYNSSVLIPLATKTSDTIKGGTVFLKVGSLSSLTDDIETGTCLFTSSSIFDMDFNSFLLASSSDEFYTSFFTGLFNLDENTDITCEINPNGFVSCSAILKDSTICKAKFLAITKDSNKPVLTMAVYRLLPNESKDYSDALDSCYDSIKYIASDNLLNISDFADIGEIETNSTPEYFKKIVELYNTIGKENNLSYKTPINTSSNYNKDGKYTDYSFTIKSLNNSSSESISINQYDDGTLIKGFYGYFDEKFDIQTLKDFLIASIMIADNSLNFSEATSVAKTLINSYKGTGYSDIYKTDTYCVFLGKVTILDENTGVYIIPTEEINSPVDESLYQDGDYDMISSPLNLGEAIKINVIIESIDYSNNLFPSTMKVTDSDNNKFEVSFFFKDFCTKFELQKSYTFYGIITKSGGLRLEYYK